MYFGLQQMLKMITIALKFDIYELLEERISVVVYHWQILFSINSIIFEEK